MLRTAIDGARSNDFATLRYEALLRRVNHELMPVHVIVSQIDSSRERRSSSCRRSSSRPGRTARSALLDQAQANKELIRNLAHEIKNPLGGIRGAAQLLEMELESRDLTEYTQVIINEADRLQTLVDRLLAPHRRPHVVGDVNIHEVCERVRSLILAEFPRGLHDRARLRHLDPRVPRRPRAADPGHAQHRAQRRAGAGRAASRPAMRSITLRTRIARQVTLDKQRYRLALELHVIDNGPGVPDAIKDRIFYPLVSGREGGTGLGLTLAQTFVQQHHGMIECDSVPGRTDFKILIPLP